MKNSHCKANALAEEFESIARKRGIITLSLYPILSQVLASPCDCGDGCAVSNLKKLIAGFNQRVRFVDGFTITPEQGREALEHFLFDGGSVVNRRNYIIAVIFEIDPDSRRGWDQGTFKRENQRRLLFALAEHLLDDETADDEEAA
ncbi:hypothetical protein QF038_001799 [Pseudarthrobacter sp. W1I19]|uniref:hypothetical protein n=1 Tax=Pseudarthrobacter sp. W1I19 TaxID=3042288 RepID=UPI00277E1EBD|nr:hypothetical protein [Pseudarthrobacter sp. W1I19]MDQ0923291.1 hypothetical protein [Pseudarthrobacter sp. W1I19]